MYQYVKWSSSVFWMKHFKGSYWYWFKEHLNVGGVI